MSNELVIRIRLDEDDESALNASLNSIKQKIGEIMADITALTAAINTLDTDEQAAATELSALAAQIAQLNTAQAPTQEQIDALTAHATAIATSLSSATTAAEQPATPVKALYKFTASEGVVADARFTPSGFRVPGSLEVLFYFSGDGNPGEAQGVAVPGYTAYTGATEAVPAA